MLGSVATQTPARLYRQIAFPSPQLEGTKSEVAASPLPSRGPTSGRNCYITLAFSGVPKQRDKIKSGYLTPAFSGAHKWAELLRNPSFSGVPKQGDNSRGHAKTGEAITP